MSLRLKDRILLECLYCLAENKLWIGFDIISRLLLFYFRKTRSKICLHFSVNSEMREENPKSLIARENKRIKRVSLCDN